MVFLGHYLKPPNSGNAVKGLMEGAMNKSMGN